MNKTLKARIIEVFGTQADFSTAIDTDETIVSKVVRGRRKLDPETQKLWAKTLKCRPGDLFKG